VSIVCIVQARMNSTRLPGKVMRQIKGKPLIGYTIDRVLTVPGFSHVVVALPACDAGSLLAGYVAGRKDVTLYVGGEENDLVERFQGVISLTECDAFIRICGDSPLVDPNFIFEGLTLLLTSNTRMGFFSNAGLKSVSPGNSVEGCGADTYKMIAEKCAPEDREHAGFPWMYRQIQKASMLVDTADDFERVKAVIEAMDGDHRAYGWMACANLL
jgi:spore coat polysaccharide biosynthesis protein SpsF